MDSAQAVRILSQCGNPYIEEYPEITWRYVSKGLSDNGRELNDCLADEFKTLDDVHKAHLARKLIGVEHHSGLLVLIDAWK